MIEFLDVINDNDEVIGTAPQPEIYAKKLFHRIVHVLVFNDKGEMLLQKRSANKSFCPLHWSTSVGGHVQAGENYERAALREALEELGVRLRFERGVKEVYTDGNGLKKMLVTYRVVNNGPFTLNPLEVDSVRFFGIDRIKKMVENKEKFHPELMFILKKYF